MTKELKTSAKEIMQFSLQLVQGFQRVESIEDLEVLRKNLVSLNFKAIQISEDIEKALRQVEQFQEVIDFNGYTSLDGVELSLQTEL